MFRKLRSSYLLLTALLSTGCPGGDKPTINSFAATPMNVQENATTTLAWDCTDADNIKITATPGGEVVNTATAKGTQVSAAIADNTMFTLEATNDEGSVSRTISVLVQKGDNPTIDSFTATPEMVESGGAVVLAWETTNADSVDITPSVVTGGDADGMTTVNPVANTTFTLTARGPGGMATANVSVTIAGPQIMSFTATPQAVQLGDETIFGWTVTDATTIRITDPDGDEVTTSTDLMGMFSYAPPALGAFEFTLTALDAAERMATRTVTVNVNPQDGPAITFTANPATIMLGQTSSLEWSVTDPTGIAGIEISDGTNTATITTDPSGSITVSPLANTTYTLTARNNIDITSMAMAMVTVQAGPPPILAFDAAPNPIALGGQTTLTWSTLSADTVRILAGTTELLNTTSSTGTLDVTQTVTSTVYTLEATNTLGSNTSNVTVFAHAPAVINDFTATPLSFTQTSTVVTLAWDVSSVSSLTLLADGAPVAGFPVVNTDPMAIDSTGTFDVPVAATTRFTLMAQSAGGADVANMTVASLFVKTETGTIAIPLAGDGGGASGNLSPAGDEDWYVVTVPAGGNIVAFTSDGAGGCDTDTRMRVYSDPAGAAIADNNDIDFPVNNCSLVTPFANPDVTPDLDLANMAAGDYYIRVNEGGAGVTGPYVIQVLVGAAACGNTLLELVEQCDDGNVGTGDGCDGGCNIEPLGVVTGPQAPGTPASDFPGSINPANQRDYYRVDMAGPGYIFAETYTGAPGLCTADTVLTLLDASLVALGSDDNDGINSCSIINPEFDPFAFVPAGTYWLRVEDFGNNTLIPNYGILIRTVGSGCGNGILETQPPLNEICDDGNALNGDGCSNACIFEGVSETEPNNTFNDTGVITVTADTVFTGSTIGTDTDYYAITVPQGYHIDAYVTVNSFNSCPESPEARVRLYDTNGTTVLATNDNSGPQGNCGRVFPGNDIDTIALDAGTYFLQVIEDSTPRQDLPSYYLHVSVIAPGCGNGVVDAALLEQCDDGNLIPGDGCDATCGVEAVGFGTLPSATPLVFADSINPIGQHDFFELTVTATVFLRVETFAPNRAAGCPSGNDTLVSLNDENNFEINRDDDDGLGFCSLINPNVDAFALVGPGTYFLEVWEFNDDGVLASYEMVVQGNAPDSCGNFVLEGTEQCDDGNAVNGDGCNSACSYEISPTIINPPGGTAIVQVGAMNTFQLVQINITSPGQSITATAADVGGTTCNSVNTALVLADDEFAVIGQRTVGGPTGTAGECANIRTPHDVFAQELAVGTYYLGVFNEGATGGMVQVNVGITNLVLAGSGSVPSPQPVAFTNSISRIGEHDIYQITVTQEVYLRAETFAPNQGAGCLTGNDTVMAMLDSNLVWLGEDDEDGLGSCSLIRPTDAFSRVLPGVYHLEVWDWLDNATIAAYQLVVTGVPVDVCGNGVSEAVNNETCDDGNTNNGDGCSATCTLEGTFVPEVEANNTPATATPLGTLAVGITDVSAAITPIADNDFFSFTLAAPANVLLATYGAPGQFGTSCTGDTLLWLYDNPPTNFTATTVAGEPTLLGYDDQDGFGDCSQLNGTDTAPVRVALAAGTYYVQVRRWLDSATIVPYYVRIDLQ